MSRRSFRFWGRELTPDDFARAVAALGVWHVLQSLLEQLTLRLEGEHMLRRPLEHVVAEGFLLEHAERSKAGIIERVVARKRMSDLSGQSEDG